MTPQEKRQVLIDVVTSLNRHKNTGLEIRDLEYVGFTLRVTIKFNKSTEYYYHDGCTFHFADTWFTKDYRPSLVSGFDFSKLVIPEDFDERQIAIIRIAYYIWNVCLEHNK